MNKATKFWTGAVAYVSLGVGSGVSIAGNVADTFRTRPLGVDAVDVILAVFAPLAVLLVIEMFVSTLWPETWGPQVIRWVSTVLFGAVAGYVSWHHLSDLLLSRGQDPLLSRVEPLAIDGLAIMATALILSSRRARGQVDKPVDTKLTLTTVLEDKDQDTLSRWTGPVATEADVQESEAAFRGDLSTPVDIPLDTFPEVDHGRVDIFPELDTTNVQWTPPADVPLLDAGVPDTLPSWLDGLQDRTGPVQSVQAAPLIHVVTSPQRNAARLTDAERAEIANLAAAGREAALYTVLEIRTLLAAWYGVSVKTIQRAEVMS